MLLEGYAVETTCLIGRRKKIAENSKEGAWPVIDFKSEILKYKPFDIDKDINRHEKLSEDAKESILLYNKALQNLKGNGGDIAVIQLRKAVSLDPGFLEAVNLLGLCYLEAKDYGKAVEIFEAAEKIDETNTEATVYRYTAASMLRRRNGGRGNSRQRDKSNESTQSSSNKRGKLKTGKTLIISLILLFTALIIISLLIIFISKFV